MNVAPVFDADQTFNFAAMIWAIDPGFNILRLADIFTLQQIWIFIVLAMFKSMEMMAFPFGIGGLNGCNQ